MTPCFVLQFSSFSLKLRSLSLIFASFASLEVLPRYFLFLWSLAYDLSICSLHLDFPSRFTAFHIRIHFSGILSFHQLLGEGPSTSSHTATFSHKRGTWRTSSLDSSRSSIARRCLRFILLEKSSLETFKKGNWKIGSFACKFCKLGSFCKTLSTMKTSPKIC